MKRNFKKYWGIYVPLFFGILTLLFWGVGKMLSLTLRIMPFYVLKILNIVSIFVFLFWLFLRLRACTKRKNKKYSGVLTLVYAILTIAVAGVVCYYSILLLGYSFDPEHVVERNGIKMVARVSSLIDVNVHYYAYENDLYYGEELGYEWYGDGHYDPIATEENFQPIRWEFHDLSGNPLQSGETEVSKIENSSVHKMTRDADTAEHTYRFIYTTPYYWSRQTDACSPTRIGITTFDENMEAETGRVYVQNYLLNDQNEPVEKADEAVLSALLKDLCPDTAQAYIDLLRRGFSEKAKENGWGKTEIQNPVFGVVEGDKNKMVRVQFDLIQNGEKQAVLQYVRADEPYMLTAFFSDAEIRTSQTDSCFWALDSLKATKRNK